MITEAGSRGIIANGCPHPRGNTVDFVPITAKLPRWRGYRGVPAIPITVPLSDTVRWIWWDWRPIFRIFLRCFDTVGWVFWPI